MNVFYGKAKQQNQLEENARNKQTENTILNNHSNPVLDMMDSGNIKQQLNYSQEIEEEIDQFEEYINVDSIINDKIYNPSQNYDYQNVIKANPLLHNKGSSLNITVIQFIEQEQALSRSNFVDIEEDKEFSDAIRPQKNKFNTDSLNGFVFTRAHYSPIGKLCGSLGKVISSEDLKFLSIRSETPRMESKKSSRKGTGNNRDFGNILVEDLNNHNQQPIISGRNASPTKQKMGNNFIMPNTGVDQMSPREMKSPKKLKIVKFTRKQSASGLSPQLKTKKLSLLAKSKSGEEELPQIENSNFKQKAKRMETEELKDSKQQLINKKTLSNSNVRRKTADLNSSKIISEQNSEADQNLMKRMPSILKKRTLYQKQVTPTKQQSSMLIQQAKKQVRFNPKTTIHEYEKLKDISDSSSSEESEENNFDQLNGQIIEESKNYLYNKKDIELLSQVKKPFHKFIIPPDDPVFKYDYNYLFFKDRETKKRFYTEYKVCKGYFKRKARLSLDDKTAKTFKKVFQRRPSVPNFTQKPDGTKKHTRKTLVFDLDNTLIKSAYKKHKLSDYDSYIYVNILGNKRIRLYISYRPFVREMLEQLRQDFELVLYSSQSKDYTQKVALLLTINPNENYPCVFHHVLSKDECIYADDIDMYISDLDLLADNRNLKDIIILSDSLGRTIKHLKNCVPVRSFTGNKKDYSMVALVRYLKSFIRVKDIREKILQDFKTIDY